jgi:spermidine synthase
MLKFTHLKNPTHDQIRQIISLYRAEGWWTEGPEDPDLVARIISGSHCFLVASIDDQIIGMGRAISDGASDSYLQDITVKESFRGNGIGSQIIELLVKRLNGDGLKWIGLVAEKGSHGFYQRLGFNKMPDSIPMLKRE